MTGNSRDLGLKSLGAGKGDAPRNVSAKFFQNYDEITWGPAAVPLEVLDSRFVRVGNKLRKTYK